MRFNSAAIARKAAAFGVSPARRSVAIAAWVHQSTVEAIKRERGSYV